MSPEPFNPAELSTAAPRWVQGTAARGACIVAATGACWALLCGWLALDGRAPSRAAFGIPAQQYYVAQAAFVIPLLLSQWLLCTAIARGVLSAAGVHSAFAASANALAVALALPLVGLVLVPDFVVYALLGFGALGKIVRVTGPLCMLAAIVMGTALLRRLHPVTTARAALAAGLGVFTQALLGGLLLR